MYIPSHFREADERVLGDFIDAHAFGTLVTIERGAPFASHLPFLHDREARTLHAHVARGNPQWQHIAANPDVLAMFQGPHGYVSPTWYAGPGVPTWNYTAVHVYGRARVLDDAAATGRHVERLAARFERGSAAPWVPSYDPKMLGGIVGIEIRITELQGKFKVSQNRSAEDRERVAARLESTGADNDVALARLVAGERSFP
ncbi:MAG TPA: FMN-binding negative transcriptional regulator [Gammaproteobacteria bacterium]|nr:FMN-binding negative transcriptional regulator [Gammaproteobacteria bacterium]